jgi:hypothetical protein
MKKTQTSKQSNTHSDELRDEYAFDYSKARPNRFAGREKERMFVAIDPDVARVFTTPEAVNRALRALISALPDRGK